MSQFGKWFVLSLVLAVVVFASTSTLHAQARTGEPFVVTSPLNTATPFNFKVPTANINGRPAVAAVIEFVTADCEALPGTTTLGTSKLTVLFKSNFAFYSLPFEAPIQFPNTTEFISAQKTLIFADPGSTISYGFSAGAPTCTVTFSGYLIP